MYFVTSKREGYILFCTTPSERAAVGLTDPQMVHLLVRPAVGDDWRLVAQWKTSDYSHTDFLAALHHVDEPAAPEGLLAFLPASLRDPAAR
jgi:hypothetical protein